MTEGKKACRARKSRPPRPLTQGLDPPLYTIKGLNISKAAILVVICPLSTLIDSHIQELKDHGISACSLTDQDILEEDVAKHSVVFTSPELIVREKALSRSSVWPRYRGGTRCSKKNLFSLLSRCFAVVYPMKSSVRSLSR